MDGFNLESYNSSTYSITRPGSSGTPTVIGLWSVARQPIFQSQNLTSKTSNGTSAEPMWILFTNENRTLDYTFDCSGGSPLLAPFQSGTTVRNLLPPFESYNLAATKESYYNNSVAPWRGCISGLTISLFGFKVLVPQEIWVPPLPALTKFLPGHDARILSNSSTIEITLQFNTVMSCSGVTSALSANASSNGQFSSVSVHQGNCGNVSNPDPSPIPSGQTSVWYWSGTLQNVPDGIIQVTVKNAPNNGNTQNTSVRTCPFYANFYDFGSFVSYLGRRSSVVEERTC